MHIDSVGPGDKVIIHDDLLATGGTAQAAAKLISGQGAEIVGFSFIVELSFLNGRDLLTDFSKNIKALLNIKCKMNFDLTADQLMIQQMVRDFAEQEIRPNLNKWDKDEIFPLDTMKKMGELGLLGIFIPVEYGGSGFSYFEYATVLMELGKVCGGVGLSVAAHNSLCTGHIFYHGNEEQKKKYLPKLASGEWIGAWGLTEANTGSDAMRMKTTAVQDGDDWIINGTKNWITHGLSGDLAVVLIRTGDLLDSNGITAFIIEKGTPGFSAVKIKDKLGVRASETAELIFDNVRVPKENVIGNVGDGFKQAMKVLDGGRVSIASLSCGIARGAYEASVKYAKEREQFGKPISKFQGISFKLADMATEVEAAELNFPGSIQEK